MHVQFNHVPWLVKALYSSTYYTNTGGGFWLTALKDLVECLCIHSLTQSAIHAHDKQQLTTDPCGTDIDNGKSGTVPEVPGHLEGMVL